MYRIQHDKLTCMETGCHFKSECANHVTAGGFRLEDGFSPELVAKDSVVFCKTHDRPLISDTTEMLPENYDQLDFGFVSVVREVPEPDNLAVVTNIAIQAHAGQTRKCGIIPYIFHPIQVTQLLIEWGVKDPALLCAAIAHDVLEDCDQEYHFQIEEALSDRAYLYVQELTRPEGMDKDEYIQSFQRKQTGTVLIKVADGICNTEDFLRYKVASGQRYWAARSPLFEVWKNISRQSFTKEIIENVNARIERVDQKCR